MARKKIKKTLYYFFSYKYLRYKTDRFKFEAQCPRVNDETLLRQFLLHWPISHGPAWVENSESQYMTCQLTTDGELVPVQQFGYFRLFVSGFHNGVNLISFSLAEVFVGHGQPRQSGQEVLNAKHPQSPNH